MRRGPRFPITRLLVVLVVLGGATIVLASTPDVAAPPDSAPVSPEPMAPPGIPDAYLHVGDSPQVGQEGTLLSWHWYSADGHVADFVPEGRAVSWPEPLLLHGSPSSVRLRVDALREPAVVELRTFADETDLFGVPQASVYEAVCDQGTRTGPSCTWFVSEDGIEVRPQAGSGERPSMLMIVYVEWYVPPSERPSVAPSNPIVSASWGFRTVIGS